MAISVRAGEFAGTLERGRYDGGFAIRSLAVRPQGQVIAEHTHDEAHFFLVVAGGYLSSARGAPEAARPPFLVFDPPGTTHSDRFAADRGAFVAVTLSAEAFAQASAADALPDHAVALSGPEAMAAALRIARALGGADGAVLEAGAWELVANATAAPEPDGAPVWAHTAFEAVMDEAADPELSVARVAAAAGVHPTHLARVFRQAWGCSPGELMRWRRLESAADLLRRTRAPLAEIAQDVGFADQAHMTHAFRARYGLTPQAFRRARDVAPIQDATREAA